MRNSVKLPPAFGDLDGKGTVLIPTNAITFDGNLDANVVGCEQVLGKHLISLEMNGERMFAVSDTELPLQAVKVGLDLKRITLTIDGRTHEPLHEVVQFKGKVIKRKRRRFVRSAARANVKRSLTSISMSAERSLLHRNILRARSFPH